MMGDERPSRRNATIHDVASLAGVSIGTVSKALNATGSLSQQTRERVMEAAKTLDFRPNMLAKSLHTGLSGTIGLISNDSFGRFTLPIMEGLEHVQRSVINYGMPPLAGFFAKWHVFLAAIDAHLYVLAVIVLTMGWLAVLAMMFGRSIDGLTALASGGEANPLGVKATVAAIGAILLTWLIVAKGPTSIKVFNMIVSPALVNLMLVMLRLILREHSWADLQAMPALDPPFEDHHLNFIIAIEVNMAAGFSWWPYIGNLARLTKGERTAFWPNIIGIFGAAALGEAPTRDTTGDPVLCRAWTALGIPCINLPIGFGNHGLPLGLQVAARPGQDDLLLEAAARIAHRLGTLTIALPELRS